MKLKHTLMAAIAAVYIAFAPIPSPAMNIKVEPVFAQKGMVLDTKLGGKLPGSLSNIGYFMRNRTFVDYENNVDAFSLVDLIFPLGKGFDFVFESQFTAGKPYDPRVGAQYAHDFGNGLNAYVLITRSWGPLPNMQITPVIGYERKINPKLRFAGRLEAPLTLGDREGYLSDSARIRLGFGEKGWLVGPALDISGIWSGEPEYTPELFFQLQLN